MVCPIPYRATIKTKLLTSINSNISMRIHESPGKTVTILYRVPKKLDYQTHGGNFVKS